MPREVLEFRVVVASPSDVFETRKVVFDVIHELNRAFEIQRISIRGLGWEEYVTPGIGADAQTVINEQLLREYDILIALFATKLGTPTSNAASGTVEEIEHAIANTDSAMGKYRVQVYFRDKIESASSISIDELKRVDDYRKQLEPKGVLYRLFRSDDELQREILVNIQRPIFEYFQKRGGRAPTPVEGYEKPASAGSAPVIGKEAASAVEEFGLLDHVEKAEEAIQVVVNSLNRITSLIEEIGAETNKQVAEIERISVPNISAKEKKNTVNGFASFLKSKAIDLKQEAALARGNFEIFTSSVITAASVEREDGDIERFKKNLAEFLKEADTLLSFLPANRASIVGFKSAVDNLPRITIQFNQAKKLLLDALNECLQLFDQTERAIYEIAAKT